MALYQRRCQAGSAEYGSKSPSEPPASDSSAKKLQLLLASEVPPWYAHNPHLRTGYRPVNASIELCVDSLRFVHNETVNIYSHLIPAVIAVIGNCVLHLYLQYLYPGTSLTDRMAIHVYLSTSMICFGVSSLYHTLNCHSESYSNLWARWDYAAISLQTIGSFISGIHFTFYCNPGLQMFYWAMICVLGLLSTIAVVNPRYQGTQWRWLRITIFVVLGFSALAPIIHAAIVFPFALLNQQAGLSYYLLEGLALITGTVFYATHFPESWVPEKFDFWGASHQIFHVFVVLAAAIHMRALLSVYGWVYKNARCLH